MSPPSTVACMAVGQGRVSQRNEKLPSRLECGVGLTSVSENREKARQPLTCGLLHEHNLGLGSEVLAGENHLLAPVHQAAVHVLSLYHGQLVGRALS